MFFSAGSETEMVDEEDTVFDDFRKDNKTVNKPVTRLFPNLIQLSNEAKDPIDFVWQKRPNRVPQKLPPQKRLGSKFINFKPTTPPLRMFLEMWNEAGNIALSGAVMFLVVVSVDQ